jgi:hypothetical protein
MFNPLLFEELFRTRGAKLEQLVEGSGSFSFATIPAIQTVLGFRGRSLIMLSVRV